MKLEETRQKREDEAQLKQTELENERRRQEREHELKVLKLLSGAKASNNQNLQVKPKNMVTPSSSYSSWSPIPWQQGITHPSTSVVSGLNCTEDANYTFAPI